MVHFSMSHTNRVLIQQINPLYRDHLGYFPDTLFYQHDNVQYQQKIAGLARASYLYSDGYSLKTVGAMRYYFETFKGLFGYTNHCQIEKIQLALRKFAYYGYLQNYQQPQAQLQSLGIDTDYLHLVSMPRTNETSQQIQSKLIQFYVENESGLEIDPSNHLPQLSQHYFFGSVLTDLGLWQEIPSIDPQNEQLITRTFDQLKQKIDYRFIPKSKYAIAAADYYLGRAKKTKERYFYNWSFVTNAQAEAQRYLEYALHFFPEIISSEKEIYIEYYLEKKELIKAIALIHQLKDKEQALRYLEKGTFSIQQLQHWVEKDSWLATVISASYLGKQHDSTAIEFAANLHSNFAEIHPVQAFSLEVSKRNYDEAYRLFSNNKNTDFLQQDIAKLADFYSIEGENLYDQGHELRQSKEWEKAKEFYSKSALMKRNARDLQPDSEARKNDHFVHKRLYAQLLIDADIDLNRIEQCQIEEIMKAIKFLMECNSTNDEEKIYHQNALAKGLMRQVDYLVHRVHILYDENYKAYKRKNETNFERLTKALYQIIELLDGTENNKLILGKAYFLLADVSEEFDLKDYDPSYYKKALQTVPDNPFYLLRCAEKFSENKDEYQSKGVKLLKNLGFSVSDYYHWDNERWQRGHRVSQIKNIHNYQNENKVLIY